MRDKDKIEIIWKLLITDNVACTCCDSDREYINRVNEVAGIIGKPKWDGKGK